MQPSSFVSTAGPLHGDGGGCRHARHETEGAVRIRGVRLAQSALETSGNASRRVTATGAPFYGAISKFSIATAAVGYKRKI